MIPTLNTPFEILHVHNEGVSHEVLRDSLSPVTHVHAPRKMEMSPVCKEHKRIIKQNFKESFTSEVAKVVAREKISLVPRNMWNILTHHENSV
ncbi:hypothetical protein TNCV_2617531 [Trichonephila clavipes]|nr:hypothetical protein TNCV_2617531 [Trichonephila clavipes]